MRFNILKDLDRIENGKYYYVENGKNGELHIYDEINQKLVDDLIFNNKVLAGFEYFWQKKREIELNLLDFESTINKYQQQAKAQTHYLEAENFSKEDPFININRRFVSYINSCRIFVDHMDGKIKHIYGEKSTEYSIFSKAKKYCYDTYFSYRFFYHLRNYIEHFDFPITDIHLIGTALSNGQLKPSSTSIEINFTRDTLLNDAIINKKLASDLLLKDKAFSILPLVEEFKISISYLLKTLLIIEKDNYLESLNFINRFYSERSNGDSPEIVQYFIDKSKKTISYNVIFIRIDLLYKIKSVLEEFKFL